MSCNGVANVLPTALDLKFKLAPNDFILGSPNRVNDS